MERAKTTPKDFFLWAGAMVSLYAGIVAFITLLFNYINFTFPDPLQYLGDPYSSGIPYQMATLIVLTPVFLVLMRVIRKEIEVDPSRAQIWVRRWALFLTVFVAGASIVVDLIVLLTTFLSGESLTTAFLLKVAVVLLVASAGFMHFLADLWGFWHQYPARARTVNWGVGLLVILTILAGFLIVGTPQQARMFRLDQQKVNDLQNIQWQIINFWQKKQTLPEALDELTDPLSGYTVPVDTESGEAYDYNRISLTSFTLCATFNLAGGGQEFGREISYPATVGGKGMDTWEHTAGETCFERTIDPDLYPPFTKPGM
ncbi:MAG: hypothetical protein KBD50_02920 [Candidatus Pacebacteria bacterium]|nr:hypothetical protein [Candidatus Paceibacterota bacterium]